MDTITFFIIIWILLGIEILLFFYLIKTFRDIKKKVHNLMIIQYKIVQQKKKLLKKKDNT